MVPEQLLDPLAEWPHKVLSQQPEVCVEVELGAGVALRGEVGSEERPLVLVELLRGRVDRQGPEVLALIPAYRKREVGAMDFICTEMYKAACSCDYYL